MKLRKTKPESLTQEQAAIWEAINASPYTRQEIADEAGVTITTVANLITGKHKPRRGNYIKIMDAIKKLNTRERVL